MRRTPLAAVAVLVSLALAVLSTGGVAAAKTKPAPSTTTTTTTWPPLPAFDATVAWADCGGGFQCATLTVPVDWTRPGGETLGIALTRLPAAVPDQRLGSLVINYGGPGESGLDYLSRTYGRLPQTVRDRFDVVSFDPRGTGASRPIDCVDDAFLDLSAGIAAVPTTQPQLDALHAYNKAFAAGCVQRMGKYAGQVGTRNVARDLEAIRIALGDPKLTYLGYSYGTVVGATYAQMFPASVGRLVLDGPPDYWISARDYAYRQAKGFMDALSAFLDWCQETGCSLAASGAPRDQLHQLIARVDEQPMPASYSSDGVTRDGPLTSALLENAVISLLYDRSRGWPLLADALSEAVDTGTAAALLSYSDQYLGRSTDGHWDPLVEANAVISCVDRPSKSTPTSAGRARRRRHLPGPAPPVGWVVRDRLVRRHAQAGQGRPTGRREGARHRPDPGDRHHRRPGDALRGRRGPRRPHPGLRPPHLREHRAHRVRPRHQHLHRRRRRRLPRRRHAPPARHPLHPRLTNRRQQGGTTPPD